MDELFLQSLFMSIKTTKLSEQNSELFPLPASSLFSAYMNPNRPHNSALDIKKSSYKKVKFDRVHITTFYHFI